MTKKSQNLLSFTSNSRPKTKNSRICLKTQAKKLNFRHFQNRWTSAKCTKIKPVVGWYDSCFATCGNKWSNLFFCIFGRKFKKNPIMKIVSSFFHRNMISNEHRFTRAMPPSRSPGRITSLLFNPTVEWYWKCLVKPICLKVGAVMALVMSILVIWSEITFFRFVSQHYSLFKPTILFNGNRRPFTSTGYAARQACHVARA